MSKAIFWLLGAALATHVCACLAQGQIVFAVLGGIILPVGIAHGLMLWFTI